MLKKAYRREWTGGSPRGQKLRPREKGKKGGTFLEKKGSREKETEVEKKGGEREKGTTKKGIPGETAQSVSEGKKSEGEYFCPGEGRKGEVVEKEKRHPRKYRDDNVVGEKEKKNLFEGKVVGRTIEEKEGVETKTHISVKKHEKGGGGDLLKKFGEKRETKNPSLGKKKIHGLVGARKGGEKKNFGGGGKALHKGRD